MAIKFSRVKQWLAHERAPLVVTLVAVLLVLPTLSTGPIMDDHAHRLSFHSDFLKPGGPRGDWDLFRFVDEEPGALRRLMDRGLWPWWAAPGMRLSFMRPISSLWHAFDYRVYPDVHGLMHFGSVFAYGVTVLLAGLFYRRLLGVTACAGLAALLFAVDDAHSMVIVWIANRHAILSTAFGIAALLAYDRARRDGWKPGVVLSPLALAASLFSGESGVSTLAYLCAHAVFLDEAKLRARAAALLPHVATCALWFVAYKLGGFGAAGGAFYIDPVGQPGEFLAAAAIRLPVLLAGQMALPPADAWMALPPEKISGFVTVCLLVVVVVAGGLFAALRRDRKAGFFALGVVLCLVPACATWPSDRMLLFSGLGGFGLVAMMLSASREGLGRPARWLVGVVSSLFVFCHVIVAPILLPVRAYGTGMMLSGFSNRAIESLPPDDVLGGKTLVIVSSPDAVIHMTALSARINRGSPYPEIVRVLSTATQGALSVSRVDERTLSVTLSDGFFCEPTSKVFRDPKKAPLRVGDKVAIDGFVAEIMSVTAEEGLPERIHFHFDRALEHPSMVFIYWNERRWEPLVIPAMGEERKLPVVAYQKAIGG